MRILFLTPDLFGPPGGIARVSRLMCKAMSESTTVEHLDVIALNDAVDQRPDLYYLSTTTCSYFSMGHNKIRFLKQILHLRLRNNYDVYITSHVNLAWPLWSIRYIGHPPTVLVSVVHGIDVWTRLAWFRRLPLLNSSLILSVSNLTKERMVKANGVKPEKVRVLPNCLDPSFAFQEGSCTSSARTNVDWIKTPCILTVSRLTKDDRYKGHIQVIQALAHLRLQLPSLTYYVVGEGDLIPELEHLCEQLCITSAVHFLGHVDEETLSELYTQADLFVMPSKGEGFGLVYLEAMAHGLPVIASNQDAANEVVQHGKTGLLVSPDDINELSKSLLQLLTNGSLRKQMGMVGQHVAITQFDYTNFKNNLLKHLHETCDDLRRTNTP